MASKSKKLFKDISISNNVSRSGFDLSFPMMYTSKVGELLPIMHKNVMFGDVFKINLETFTRTRPVITAAFTSINEYWDFFFVPYRLLGKQIPHIIAQDKDNPVIASSSSSNVQVGTKLPHLYLFDLRSNDGGSSVMYNLAQRVNEFEFERVAQSNKLLNYLGYCYVNNSHVRDLNSGEVPGGDMFGINIPVSLLPLACYQKIYYDFYRNTQWEDNVPYNYNFDYLNVAGQYNLPLTESYWNNPTMFDLRYANYPKDLFFGLLPDSQYGDTAVVSVDLNNPDYEGAPGNVFAYGNGRADAVAVGNRLGEGGYSITGYGGDAIEEQQFLGVDFGDLIGTMQSDFSILEFRKANMVQKYREIIGSGRKDYKSIVQKIFNVDVPDTLSDMVTYLGGHSNVIKINEVENTNLVDSDDSAIQRGKGLGSSRSNLIEFEAKEAGIIMCIYHAMPKIDYALNAFHFDVTKIDVDDFANPVFDKLGFQELPTYYLDNSSSYDPGSSLFLGYTSRYVDYKTSIGMVVGDFRETLTSWLAPVSPDYLVRNAFDVSGYALSANFFKVNPRILDSIFDFNADSYVDSDQLRTKVYFNIHAVRNLNYIGLPNS